MPRWTLANVCTTIHPRFCPELLHPDVSSDGEAVPAMLKQLAEKHGQRLLFGFVPNSAKRVQVWLSTCPSYGQEAKHQAFGGQLQVNSEHEQWTGGSVMVEVEVSHQRQSGMRPLCKVVMRASLGLQVPLV